MKRFLKKFLRNRHSHVTYEEWERTWNITSRHYLRIWMCKDDWDEDWEYGIVLGPVR